MSQGYMQLACSFWRDEWEQNGKKLLKLGTQTSNFYYLFPLEIHSLHPPLSFWHHGFWLRLSLHRLCRVDVVTTDHTQTRVFSLFSCLHFLFLFFKYMVGSGTSEGTSWIEDTEYIKKMKTKPITMISIENYLPFLLSWNNDREPQGKGLLRNLSLFIVMVVDLMISWTRIILSVKLCFW